MDAAAAVEASAGMEAEGWLPQLNECAAQDGADRGNWKTHLLPLIKIKRERETSSFLSLRWGPGRRIRGFTHFLSAPGAFTPQNSTNSATFFLSIFHPCVCILSLIVTTVKLFFHPRPTAWSKRKWRRHQTGKREREQSHRSLLLVAKMCALFAAAAAS